jgi:hypothetical protein
MDPSDDTQKTPKSRDNVNISPFWVDCIK